MPGTITYQLLRDSEDGDDVENFTHAVFVGNISGPPITSVAMLGPSLTDLVHQTYRMKACSQTNCPSAASVLAESTLAVAGSPTQLRNLAAGVVRGTGINTAGEEARPMATATRATIVEGTVDILALGMPGADNSPGAVYIYERRLNSSANWVQAGPPVTKGGAANGDRFGQSVALSPNGNWMAVGAPGDDQPGAGVDLQLPPRDPGMGPHPPVSNSGAVYVYQRTGSAWTLFRAIKAINPDPSDAFGASVAIADNGFLAVGAPNEGSGAAGGSYTASVDPRDFSVDLNPAVYGNVPASAESGAVYLFQIDFVRGYRFYNYIKPSLSSPGGAHFGASLAMDAAGVNLAIGAPRATVLGPNAGAVMLYEFKTSNWRFVGDEGPSDTQSAPSDRGFGGALSMSTDGAWLAVGYAERTVNGTSAAGEVYLYGRDASAGWTKKESLISPQRASQDRFGIGVALWSSGSDLRLLVGSREDDTRGFVVLREQDIGSTRQSDSSGAAFLFTGTASSTLKLRARLESPAPLHQEFMGLRVALSRDGGTPLLSGLYKSEAQALFYAY